MMYAPGYYAGYGVKTLPGIREGLEERNGMKFVYILKSPKPLIEQARISTQHQGF